ncbi:MAG: hypothetical protein MRY78_12990, partial [Saprospiraceae bacterium]|nr:hypothetical protein [Saprospiraceae bacterium]
MKYALRYFSLLLLMLAHFQLASQNCSEIIVEDRIINGTHMVRTVSKTMVVRGNYSYALEFLTNSKGVTAKVYSKAGVEFNIDDEIIFMDANKNRKSYRFIEMGEMVREKGTPVYQNILQLDIAAMEWFERSQITTIYIKNNSSNQMRKFTFNGNRQTEFRQMAACFMETLDKEKINDVKLVGNDLSVRPKLDKSKSSSEPTSSDPTPTYTSNSSNSSSSNSSMSAPVNDREADDLRQELVETKERLRAEIRAEKQKANDIKRKLVEEVAAIEERAAKDKEMAADEVVAEREKAQAEIAKIREDLAKQIA